MKYEPSQQDLQHLREWIRNMPQIVQDYDDYFLSTVMMGCKGRLGKTKTVLENFNAFGIKYPDLFGSLDPLMPELVETLEESFIFPLPKKLDGDTIVAFATLGPDYQGDPLKCHFIHLFRYWLLWFYVFTWERNQGGGKWVIIFDFQKSSLTHFREMTPTVIKNLLNVLRTSLPARPKSVHLLNVPSTLIWWVNFIKNLLPNKLGGRIHCHKTMDSFYSHIPKEILPKEYGGDEECLKTLNINWKKKIDGYRDRLLEEEAKMKKLDKFRKRSNGITNFVETFRSLNID